ncbi:MAG TPA: NAD(P)H nitroreductase [Mycobacterium sp.]
MPETMVDSRIIKDAVRLACRAPSLHNSQPWRWEADRDGLQLFLDRTRVVQSTDRSGREAIISCGAVLDHLRVAIAAAGWSSTVDRFPNPNNPDHLATVSFLPMDFVTDAHRRRADAILLRRTDRLPLAAPPDWEAVELMLRAGLDDETYLDVLAEDARPQLADASQLSEALRLYDSPYHAELSWWTAAFEPIDGIPYSSLISAAESERVEVGRTFPVTRHGERRPGIDDDRATVLVLSTDGDGPENALRCGEAMSAVLLECTMAGLATCTVTHVTEIDAARELVAALTGRAALPQLLIRAGLAPALEQLPPPTPRRPLDDVLRFC